MKRFIAVASLLILSACSGWDIPGSAPQWNHGNGQNEFVWVGCHKVTKNPAVDGSVAAGPFGISPDLFGNVVFFKQKSKDGNTVPMQYPTC